jgi:hypothetical protein
LRAKAFANFHEFTGEIFGDYVAVDRSLPVR